MPWHAGFASLPYRNQEGELNMASIPSDITSVKPPLTLIPCTAAGFSRNLAETFAKPIQIAAGFRTNSSSRI